MIDNKTPDPNANAINSLNQIALGIAQLAKTFNAVFPQIVGTSTSSIQSGAIVPLNYVGYLDVTIPSTGQTAKVGYYL